MPGSSATPNPVVRSGGAGVVVAPLPRLGLEEAAKDIHTHRAMGDLLHLADRLPSLPTSFGAALCAGETVGGLTLGSGVGGSR